MGSIELEEETARDRAIDFGDWLNDLPEELFERWCNYKVSTTEMYELFEKTYYDIEQAS